MSSDYPLDTWHKETVAYEPPDYRAIAEFESLRANIPCLHEGARSYAEMLRDKIRRHPEYVNERAARMLEHQIHEYAILFGEEAAIHIVEHDLYHFDYEKGCYVFESVEAVKPKDPPVRVAKTVNCHRHRRRVARGKMMT